jgi:hypothetical protein
MAYASAWRRVEGIPGRSGLVLALGMAVELGWCLFAAASRLQAFTDQGLGYSLAYLFAAALSVGFLVWGGLRFSAARLTEPGRGRRDLLVLLVFAVVAQAGAVVLLEAVHAGRTPPAAAPAHAVETAGAAPDIVQGQGAAG